MAEYNFFDHFAKLEENPIKTYHARTQWVLWLPKKNCISRGRIQIPVVFIKSPMIEIIIKDTLNPFTPKI